MTKNIEMKLDYRNKKGGFQLLSEHEIRDQLAAIARTILKRHPRTQDLILIGIRTGGVFLAERLQTILTEMSGTQIPLGLMDITLYRDDTSAGLPRPEVGPTQLPCAIDRRRVILVDDVLYTGRTVRSALAELMDFGRPRCVELAVLVDRGHRELPIRANYVGLKIKTLRSQTVQVYFKEQNQKDRVEIL